MSGSLVADLGVGPEVWLFLTLLGYVTLFFKFSRIWSVRNFDLLLLFAPTPGMMRLVGHQASQPRIAFLWLFFGSALWLTRCLIDLGLARRPLLEPNLNAAGLACLALGMLGLLVVETVSLPVDEGVARNPADPGGPRPGPPLREPSWPTAPEAAAEVLKTAPLLPRTLKHNPAQVDPVAGAGQSGRTSDWSLACSRSAGGTSSGRSLGSPWRRATCSCPTPGWSLSIAASLSPPP